MGFGEPQSEVRGPKMEIKLHPFLKALKRLHLEVFEKSREIECFVFGKR